MLKELEWRQLIKKCSGAHQIIYMVNAVFNLQRNDSQPLLLLIIDAAHENNLPIHDWLWKAVSNEIQQQLLSHKVALPHWPIHIWALLNHQFDFFLLIKARYPTEMQIEMNNLVAENDCNDFADLWENIASASNYNQRAITYIWNELYVESKQILLNLERVWFFKSAIIEGMTQQFDWILSIMNEQEQGLFAQTLADYLLNHNEWRKHLHRIIATENFNTLFNLFNSHYRTKVLFCIFQSPNNLKHLHFSFLDNNWGTLVSGLQQKFMSTYEHIILQQHVTATLSERARHNLLRCVTAIMYADHKWAIKILFTEQSFVRLQELKASVETNDVPSYFVMRNQLSLQYNLQIKPEMFSPAMPVPVSQFSFINALLGHDTYDSEVHAASLTLGLLKN